LRNDRAQIDHRMKIVAVEKAETWILEGLNALLPQLSETAPDLSLNELEQILASDGTTLLAALDQDQVVGSLTLVIFRIPTALRARIEDVVVDASARGRGIGESLVRRAITLAAARGVDAVDLTTNRVRTAANRLYGKIGFEPRDTNVYRYIVS
jgi:ribosomal protein S18 acetylase RimI-like enzyme